MQNQQNNKELIKITQTSKDYSIQNFHGAVKKYSRNPHIVIPKKNKSQSGIIMYYATLENDVHSSVFLTTSIERNYVKHLPYAEIGANLSTIAVLVYCCGQDYFCYLRFRVWLYSKYFEQMIINFHQFSHYYNIHVLQLPTNQIILLINEKDILFGYCSQQQHSILGER